MKLKNRDELKTFYNKLNGKYEGYIQLSDSRISHIFKTPTKLPDWDSLHNRPNVFIFEMVLFDPIKSFSIRVRQINDSWYVEERDVKWDANSEDCKLYYSVFDNHKYQ
ncbi:TIGR04423 family type III CRISPR-associated protein [Hydrogenimonas thermophila]|uniref:TIGR04423 family type III CRISPR-associated protein n=1 Tax=Hydrogenimonas thermophila TaxID=223786 RepID=UPI0029373078|nr:TIGR04423 family type III CRISPR-associated protein [Hydrogenimonas thermophila]WOE70973.1 TIGR04423 family type III CRISPR-associated protein [Hydrogenimonas thermophila]WOE73491.1 TIGR04423 family type III CRISPR-associated protein [Hydrogenimonas thermophila]